MRWDNDSGNFTPFQRVADGTHDALGKTRVVAQIGLVVAETRDAQGRSNSGDEVARFKGGKRGASYRSKS